jgi:hypothetical protein
MVFIGRLKSSFALTCFAVTSVPVCASGLSHKYDFQPLHSQSFSTAVVQAKNFAKQKFTEVIPVQLNNYRDLTANVQVVAVKNNAAIHPQVTTIAFNHNFDQMAPNVQVVAVKNDVNKQPLAPTISYSYQKVKVPSINDVTVVKVEDYFDRSVRITSSGMSRDYVDTYLVGNAGGGEGFNKESKSKLQRVEIKIAQNPLVGCAPLSVDCSRTATDRKDEGIERLKQPNKRQQITP